MTPIKPFLIEENTIYVLTPRIRDPHTQERTPPQDEMQNLWWASVQTSHRDGAKPEEVAAVVKLMAAAPVLYAELERLRGAFVQGGNFCLWQEIDAIDAVLRSAKKGQL